MGLVHHPNVVNDGLVYCIDAANRRCYSGTGTTGADLVLGGTATLANLTFGSNNMGVFAFDGTNDYIEQDWSFTLGAGDLTMEFWVKMEGWIIHSQGANIFLSVVDPDVHEELQFGIENSTAQRLAVYLHGGSNGSKTGDGVYSWNLNQWYHLVATRISSTVALYRDGVSLTVATGATNTGDVAAISTFLLGNQYKSTQYKHDFQGEMGPIRIYNKGLTAAEVSQNYEATKSRFLPRITKSGLVGNWDAGDPASYVGGLTCKDTANGTASTLTNMEASDFNPANGGYWEFDGTDEYIQCSTDSILQPQSFSVEAWVYDDQTEHYLPIVSWANAYYPAVWTSYHSSTQRPIIYMNGPDLRYFDATAASVAGWHHVVFTYTYDDITTGAFYVDGASIAVYQTYDGTKDPTNTCTIGAALKPSGPQYYKGSMGLVRMYDRALSVAEILDNYQKTKGRFGH